MTYVATIVAILSFLIAVSVIFDLGKEAIEEEISPELKPMLTAMFGELTVLGFIGIVLFFTFKLSVIQDLNESLYEEENAVRLYDHCCLVHLVDASHTLTPCNRTFAF